MPRITWWLFSCWSVLFECRDSVIMPWSLTFIREPGVSQNSCNSYYFSTSYRYGLWKRLYASPYLRQKCLLQFNPNLSITVTNPIPHSGNGEQRRNSILAHLWFIIIRICSSKRLLRGWVLISDCQNEYSQVAMVWMTSNGLSLSEGPVMGCHLSEWLVTGCRCHKDE